MEARGASRRGWRFKVVELGGRKISLLYGDPWRGPCRTADCLVCSTEGRGPCGRPSCTYDITCKTCLESGPSTVPEREYDTEKDEDRYEDNSNGAGGRPGHFWGIPKERVKSIQSNHYNCRHYHKDPAA